MHALLSSPCSSLCPLLVSNCHVSRCVSVSVVIKAHVAYRICSKLTRHMRDTVIHMTMPPGREMQE